MFCSKCGFELADGMQFCPKCGTAVIPLQTNNVERKRHGFTTFWLIFYIVGGGLVTILHFINPELMDMGFYNVMTGVGEAIACVLILCWIQFGVQLYGICFILSIIQYIRGKDIEGIIGEIIALAVLYVALFVLKKNGRTVDDYLFKKD